jgi:hypothetical protein
LLEEERQTIKDLLFFFKKNVMLARALIGN